MHFPDCEDLPPLLSNHAPTFTQIQGKLDPSAERKERREEERRAQEKVKKNGHEKRNKLEINGSVDYIQRVGKGSVTANETKQYRYRKNSSTEE